MTVVRRLVSALLAIAIGGSPARATGDPHLIPKPREVAAGEVVPIARTVAVATASGEDDRFAAKDLAESLKARGVRVVTDRDAGFRISLLRMGTPGARRALTAASLTFTEEMKPEGYVLVTTKDGAIVVASSGAGMFYGAQTLKQLFRTDGALPRIQLAVIRDWPAMRYRGFHDDLSRGPVPTLEFQKHEIRTLAAYKVNVYSPYFEHTLSYASNPLISPPGGGMSHDDVRALVAYARHYHVDVIPEQEAFGHLHHVLKYDLYAPLGETPHGHVLAPDDPASLPLIKSVVRRDRLALPVEVRAPRRRRDRSSSASAARRTAWRRAGSGRCTSTSSSRSRARCDTPGSASSSGATSRRAARTS